MALALPVYIFSFLWTESLERSRLFSDGVKVDTLEPYVGTTLASAIFLLPVLALVVLPTTGYLAASGADTGPRRSGTVAAGVVSGVHVIVFAGLITVLQGPLAPFLGAIVLLAALAGGIVMLGVTVGVHRWNREQALRSGHGIPRFDSR